MELRLGFILKIMISIFLFCPGPPREFTPLVKDEVIPFLNKNFEEQKKIMSSYYL